MSVQVAQQSIFRDLMALTKPSIAGLSMFMTIGGYLLAGAGDLYTTVWAMLGTALIVGSANALNMAWEYETDALMSRTADRPIPAGRLSVKTATIFGLIWGLLGLVILFTGVNALTGWVGIASLFLYVCVYTPMKLRSPWALIVGAFPGAAPPLIGWTASADNLAWPGLLLFAVLFIWQIPHFLAISLYRQTEYERAGIMVWPVARGNEATKRLAMAYSTALIPCSLALVAVDAAGLFYLAVALPTGLWFWAVTLRGFQEDVKITKWARQLFIASLLYLPIIMFGLGFDRIMNVVLSP
ncbi:MAG: heme o synthase [Myxococcota bacterium]